MSSSVAGRVVLSERELRSLQEERRRRAEEEARRRREQERRRREAIFDQLQAVVRAENELRLRIAAVAAAGLAERRESRPLAATPVPPTQRERVAATHREMQAVIEELQEALDHVPPTPARLFAARLSRLRGELADISTRRQDNFSSHRERLLLLRIELRRCLDDPEHAIERWARAAARLDVLRGALAEARPQAAGDLAERIDAASRRLAELLAAGDLDACEARLDDATREADLLLQVVDETAEHDRRAAWLRRQLAEALVGLGYAPTELIDTGPRDTAGDYYRTPQGQVVRLLVREGSLLEAEFVYRTDAPGRLPPDEFAAAVEACRCWCDDATRLRERLARNGLGLEFESVLPPERGGFAVTEGRRFADEARVGRRGTAGAGTSRSRSLGEHD